MFVEVKDTTTGATAYVNSDNVLLITSSKLVGQSVIFLVGGITLTVEGTQAEISEKFSGKSGLLV